MVTIVPLDEIKRRYQDAASRVAEPYKLGVQQNTTWKTNASSAQSETNYAIRVQAAIAAKSRLNGVNKVTQETWRQKAVDQGAQLIGPAMALSAEEQSQGFAPYHSKLAALTLPPRGPKDGSNISRVKAVIDAMIAQRKITKGA